MLHRHFRVLALSAALLLSPARAAPREGDAEDAITFAGRIEAARTVEIKARVGGYLDKVNFKDGDTVKAGDLLFEIDARPPKLDLEQAEAELRFREAKLKRVEADYQRAVELFKKAAISQAEVTRLAAERDEAEAAVKVGKIAVERARLTLDMTRIVSPIDGRIGRALVTPGNVIAAGDSPTLLATVVGGGVAHCYFDVDEKSYLKLARLVKDGKRKDAKLPIRMGLADEKEFPHEGILDFIDNRVDPKTGTIGMRAAFPDPDRFLKPGLSARVKMSVGPS